ncbi:MAG: flavin reductase family protein [Lachnospiraceae bacterium]|nr:flavin reductase family protein [Lachnospiraceae bacterium]
MHNFQPFPITTLDFNPFVLIGQQWGVATVESGDKLNTTTVKWGGMGVAWDKNVAYLLLRDSKYTKELLDQADVFSYTFFDPDQKKYKMSMKYLSAVDGRKEDKLAASGFTLNRSMKVPFIDEGNFVLLLRKLASAELSKDTIHRDSIIETFYPEGDYHTLYIAEIMDILAR